MSGCHVPLDKEISVAMFFLQGMLISLASSMDKLLLEAYQESLVNGDSVINFEET